MAFPRRNHRCLQRSRTEAALTINSSASSSAATKSCAYERRLEAIEGKAMIVCMSRRICVEMYNAITKLRPEWASGPSDNGKSCVAKIVMTGSARTI